MKIWKKKCLTKRYLYKKKFLIIIKYLYNEKQIIKVLAIMKIEYYFIVGNLKKKNN